jgi:hypothetical protein
LSIWQILNVNSLISKFATGLNISYLLFVWYRRFTSTALLFWRWTVDSEYDWIIKLKLFCHIGYFVYIYRIDFVPKQICLLSQQGFQSNWYFELVLVTWVEVTEHFRCLFFDKPSLWTTVIETCDLYSQSKYYDDNTVT